LFRKILVLGHYPQRLFYKPISSHYLVHQEKIVTAAAAIAGVYHIPGYYSSRLWQKLQPPSKIRHIEAVLASISKRAITVAIKAARTIKHETSLSIDNPNEDIIEETEDQIWERSF
jgi:hypothetical protein